MKKYPLLIPNEDGWSDWYNPRMSGYKMACCDCNLVHVMEFKVMRVVTRNADGSSKGEEMPQDKFSVRMRVRRNNRSTGQLRRYNKQKENDSEQL